MPLISHEIEGHDEERHAFRFSMLNDDQVFISAAEASGPPQSFHRKDEAKRTRTPRRLRGQSGGAANC
jgi:hypothetical protein